MSVIVQDDKKIGVSVAVPVPVSIVEDLKTAPTKEYYDIYHMLNEQLNDIVETGAALIQKYGFKAFANTTKAVKINENWCTQLPHKTVAVRAGLGWIGKNCLLVTEEYGGAVRLSSLVTDAPFRAAEPIIKSRCGECRKCVEACPAKALTGITWEAGMAREKIFHKEICKEVQIERMKKAAGIEQDLCGMCFAVCPYTQRYLKQEGLQ